MAREQRRLAAIIAADVVGYSRLMGRDESGTLARLRAHRKERFEPALERHGGRLVKLTGDGVLAEFPSAVEALSAAIEIQQAMADANRDKPDDSAIVFRIGLHLGDLIVDGDDLYGDGVNVAARLESEAPAGGVLISGNLHDAVTGRLKAIFHDLGDLTLKNIDRPVRAFRAGWNAEDWRSVATTPPLAAAHSVDAPPALPDKASIAVLPFTSMSGDPELEYFADGITEDVITELSRFSSLFVIARNTSFTYKGKAVDVRQAGRALGVRYVLEGSVRKAGGSVRVTGQLIDAESGDHLWAERYNRPLDDILAVQEDVTRSIVAAVAPKIDSSEIARPRAPGQGDNAVQLTWRARRLTTEALRTGRPEPNQEAIGIARQAVAADAAHLPAWSHLGWCYWWNHAFRWGPEPEGAHAAAWSVVERMLKIDAMAVETLTLSGILRVGRGERERGIADLRRALDANPNSVRTLNMLAMAEAAAGLGQDAREHALSSLRLNPHDRGIGDAHLALAMASFAGRDYAEAMRWIEQAIQSAPTAPWRRALMIACCARSGNRQRAVEERTALDSFAPDFIPALFRGGHTMFAKPEDMEHLLEGLRLAERAE